MKSDLKPFRPELEKLMIEARTTIAADRFESVRVKTELTAAAKLGRSSCLLLIDDPVDLREAPATVALFDWCEREGLRIEWLRRLVGDVDGNAAWDLLISWRNPGHHSPYRVESVTTPLERHNLILHDRSSS